ncbi:hypothetical protein [Zavarzinia compransoris]|uniref:PEGA domain-containing protein n=1 Tax=Zavarzinia compransoris TaxID=1264899 RepID=A0A317E349_9PROT|nr:hypothetical protein [Zavarzinia compransoris]PWR20566.1 hypothetical protein DKG75_11195 [Zavarzinia compransoris]TDP43788.1 hypothetical protein DES42_10944 [Zavarzinia compransoris]
MGFGKTGARGAAALMVAALSIGGCAAIFEGVNQDITVNTNPPGASCVLERENGVIARVDSTPAIVTVRKSKHDIVVRCNKAGYHEATFINNSGTTAAVAANVAADVILTLGMSSIIDSASGADNKYDSVVNISMVPLPAGGVAGAATAAVSPASVSPAPAGPGVARAIAPDILQDTTLYGMQSNEADFIDYYDPGGQAVRQVGQCRTAGTWAVRDGRFCLHFSPAAEVCYGVGGSTGQPVLTAGPDQPVLRAKRIVAGNAENLSLRGGNCP